MSFKVAEKIGRPGTINRKPSGSIWKLTLTGGNGQTTSDRLVSRTQNGSAAALFLIPSTFSGSWQNGKVICKISSYLIREQSYAWSSGSGFLRFRINDNSVDYLDELDPLIEGTSECDSADNNIISGGGVVLPQVQIKDTNSLTITAQIDTPSVVTTCNRTARVELLFTFPETSVNDVTIQEPNWLSNFNSYTIEKIN